MRTIKGMLMTDDEGNARNMLPPEPSNVEHIEVSDCSAMGFAELITPCKNLESFKCLHGEDYGLHSGEYNNVFQDFRADGFAEPLATQQNTLESLCLDYFGSTGTDFDYGWIGNLRQYKVLKHTHLRHNYLLDIDFDDYVTKRPPYVDFALFP
ncbi:hypothetical protein BBP40_002347 [Aspergillus hancockii]|nr:hypothetical protein BBP40_002347 [Aspergillus hancockii]